MFVLLAAVDEVIGSEKYSDATFRKSHLFCAICHFRVAAPLGPQGKSKIKYQTDCNMCTARLIVLIPPLDGR
jgi:hypothetical protein